MSAAPARPSAAPVLAKCKQAAMSNPRADAVLTRPSAKVARAEVVNDARGSTRPMHLATCRLDLSHANILLDGGALRVAAALKNAPQLRELDLSGNVLAALGTAILARALAYVPHLRVLNLAGNALGDRGVAALADAPPQALANLEHLNLADNGLTDEAQAALHRLRQRCPALKVIDGIAARA